MRHEQHSTVDAFALAVRERFEAWDSSHILSGCGNKGLVPQPAVVCTRITNDGELLKPGSQRMPPPDDLPFILRQSTQVNRDAESLSNLRLRLVGEPLIELGDIAVDEELASLLDPDRVPRPRRPPISLSWPHLPRASSALCHCRPPDCLGVCVYSSQLERPYAASAPFLI